MTKVIDAYMDPSLRFGISEKDLLRASAVGLESCRRSKSRQCYWRLLGRVLCESVAVEQKPFSLFRVLSNLAIEQAVTLEIDLDERGAGIDRPLDQCFRQRVFDVAL